MESIVEAEVLAEAVPAESFKFLQPNYASQQNITTRGCR